MSHNSSSKDLNINKTFSSMKLNGGVDCDLNISQFPDLYVKGGVKIRKCLLVGGNITMLTPGTKIVGDLLGDLCGDTTVFGNLTINEGLTVQENVGVLGNVNITGCVNSGTGYKVLGTQVVGEQQPLIDSLIDMTSGNVDGNVVEIIGSGDDTNINNNFAELSAKINDIIAVLEAHGLIGN